MTEFPSVDTRELRKRLGVDIDAETFLLSLTHRSYAFENPGVEHNERLEFLGDSVLSLAIAEEVYRRYPELPEGELVKLHHVVVSTVALAKVARDLDLGRYIRARVHRGCNRGEPEDGHRRGPEQEGSGTPGRRAGLPGSGIGCSSKYPV